VLSLQRRAVDVQIEAEYREIGIRSFGRGIFHKEPVSGADLGSKRVFQIEPGDLVLSNVFAWEGAIAVASPAENGMIGSHRFMTFVALDDRIDTGWAAWFFRSEPGLELIGRASPGSAGRNRTLSIDRFGALEIPLPNIEVQWRVAKTLDRIRFSSTQLSARSAHATALVTALGVSIAARPDLSDIRRSEDGWRRVELGSVVKPASDHIVVDASASYPNLGIYSFGRGLFAKPDIDGTVTSAKILNRVREGQFIYSRLFAFEGAYAYVSRDFAGRFVSNEFPTFDVDENELDVRWLVSYLRSPDRWQELAVSSKGLGVRRQRVSVQSLLEYQVWLPPLEQQRQMVRIIDRLQGFAAARRRADNLSEALIPAALNRAFS
jgi:type I restriction enzyme S subunit